jgi:hypothetical protein
MILGVEYVATIADHVVPRRRSKPTSPSLVAHKSNPSVQRHKWQQFLKVSKYALRRLIPVLLIGQCVAQATDPQTVNNR